MSDPLSLNSVEPQECLQGPAPSVVGGTRETLVKPLCMANYHSIPHLPESRLGPKDYHCKPWQARICTEKKRDDNDVVIVTEKLDGANCGVVLLNGQLIAIGRAGYRAIDSEHSHMHAFAFWVVANEKRFRSLLNEGERCVGEWLLRAHGVRYLVPHEPFVAFDLMVGKQREPWANLVARCAPLGFITPHCISNGPSLSVNRAMELAEPSGHGAINKVEGAVWRVERSGKFDFMCKFVRHDKADGELLPQVSGKPEVINRYAFACSPAIASFMGLGPNDDHFAENGLQGEKRV